MSEVVLAIIIVGNVLAGVLGVELPVGEHLDGGLGIRSNKGHAWLGGEGQGAEHGDDEVLDIGVLLGPHVEGSLLEEGFLLGVVQGPHKGMSPQFGILLPVVEDGEEFVTEGEFVFLEEGLESAHGGIPDSPVLVLVLDDIHEDPGGRWEMDVLEGDDGLSLILEVFGGVDLVGEDLNVFVQKTGLLTTVLFAGAAEKGGEGEFDHALSMLGNSGLGEEGLELFEEVLGGIADVVGQRGDDAGDDQGFVGGLDNVTDDEGGWAGSGNDESVQEEFVFGKISSVKLLLNLFEMSVVQSGDEWDDGVWADLVELLEIGENLDILKGHMDLVDVLLEDLSGLVLSSGIQIGIVMVEEEGLGGLDVLILIMIIIFEDELDVISLSSVGWSGDGSSLDFLEDGGDHGETVLGVAFSSEQTVDDGGADGDLVDGEGAILELEVVDAEAGSVEGVPGVVVWAVGSGNARGADTPGTVLALGMGSVLADLAVMVVLTRNGDVFSVALADYGIFVGVGDGSVGEVNVTEVQLEGGGKTSLHVLGPDGDVLVEDDSLDQTTFNLDGEGFRQWGKLRESLPLVIWTVLEVILSIVQTKLDVVQLDVQDTGTSLDVELSSEVDGGGEANIVFGTGLEGGGVTVNVFLSGLEEGCPNISLHDGS